MAYYLVPDAILFEFGPNLRNSTRVWRTHGRTDGRTDRRTDRRTDIPSYRDARTHIKLFFKISRDRSAWEGAKNGNWRFPLEKRAVKKRDVFLLFPVHLFLGAETQYASKFKSVLTDGRRDKTELSFVCLCVPFFVIFLTPFFSPPGLSFPLHYGPE